MIDKDGSQCGFCTPGIIMSMYGMYINNVKPTNHNIDKYLIWQIYADVQAIYQ